MLGALVSMGASLVGGLFARSSEKARDAKNAAAAAEANARNEYRVAMMNADVRKRAAAAAAVPIVTNSQTKSWVDYEAMMDAARYAGFNPVTWLSSGGMQSYTQSASSQQVYNSQLMDAALSGSTIFQEGAPPAATARGVGEIIGSALTTGASQWVADASQERQNAFQMDLLNAQLAGRNASAGLFQGGLSGYVPTAFLAGGHTTAGNSAALASTDAPPGWKYVPGMGFVVDQEQVSSPELLLTAAVTPWINPANVGDMSSGAREAGADLINDLNNWGFFGGSGSQGWHAPQAAPAGPVYVPPPTYGRGGTPVYKPYTGR